MKSTIRKILSTVLAVAMVGAMSTNVMASEVESGDYVVTYSAAEITDVDELMKLALSQKEKKIRSTSVISSDNGLKNLTAEQILEVRKYADGSIQTDMAVTDITLSEQQAKAISASSGSASYPWISGYNVSATFYYSVQSIGGGNTYRADRVVTNITKTNATSNQVTSANHMYRSAIGAESWQNIYYSNNSATSGTQTFTLYSSHSGFYQSRNDAIGAITYGVGSQSSVNFSDGSQATCQIAAYEGR